MQPRPYQLNTVNRCFAAWKEFRRLLAVWPTGAGKTILAALVCKRFLDMSQRVLFLAHREELLIQTIDKFSRAIGVTAELEKAESYASLDARVVVGSVQTLLTRKERWPEDHFGLVVVDEAHHALADSYQSILRHFDGHAKVLGITASPDRGDSRNLGEYFECLADEISLFDLINAGYLSRISLKALPLQIDLTKVHQSAGDFDAGELGSALEPYLDQIAAAIAQQAAFRRVLCFLPLIATSQKFVEACRGAGLNAEHVDGNSPDRKEKLQRFAAWEYDVLSNAMLLTEGYDDPGINCIVVLRPTRSRPLYAQMVGRGTRICPGKENLLLLDFLWMHERHAIVRPANLIARDDFEAEQITKMAETAGAMPADLAEQMPLDLQGLAGEATKQREEALRKRLEEQRSKKAKTISAEEFALEHNSMDIAEYQETMPWESGPVTDKQMKWLRKAHIDPTTVRGKGHASKLLGLYFDKKPLTLASPEQRKIMHRMGHPNAESATADEARKFFAGLRKPKERELSL